MSLLPNTSGALEKKLEELGERYLFDNPSIYLWNPDKCPEEFLIYLAWALSVDDWSESWSEEVKRNVVKNSLDIHRLKGTTKGLQDTLDNLGHKLAAVYWHEEPEIPKGKFKVKVAASGVLIDESFYTSITRTINENKRGTLHLESLEIQSRTNSKHYIAQVVKVGENIRIMPRPPEPINPVQSLSILPFVKIIEHYRMTPKI